MLSDVVDCYTMCNVTWYALLIGVVLLVWLWDVKQYNSRGEHKLPLTQLGDNMDKKLRQAIQENVEARLKDRVDKGALVSECDYLVGAMVVMATIEEQLYDVEYDKSMGCVPPTWLFAPMRGESILDTTIGKED